MRLELHHGRLPSRRVREQACPTFEEMAAKYIAAHASGWRDRKAEATWRNSLKQHAAKLAKLPVDIIEARDVAAALKAVWHGSPSTAKKVRGRVETILDFARAAGHRRGDNPAVWKGLLEHLLPPLSTKVKHHEAVSFRVHPLTLPGHTVGAHSRAIPDRATIPADLASAVYARHARPWAAAGPVRAGSAANPGIAQASPSPMFARSQRGRDGWDVRSSRDPYDCSGHMGRRCRKATEAHKPSRRNSQPSG
jgi:hypothetical protein